MEVWNIWSQCGIQLTTKVTWMWQDHTQGLPTKCKDPDAFKAELPALCREFRREDSHVVWGDWGKPRGEHYHRRHGIMLQDFALIDKKKENMGPGGNPETNFEPEKTIRKAAWWISSCLENANGKTKRNDFSVLEAGRGFLGSLSTYLIKRVIISLIWIS